eukprot:475533_1
MCFMLVAYLMGSQSKRFLSLKILKKQTMSTTNILEDTAAKPTTPLYIPYVDDISVATKFPSTVHNSNVELNRMINDTETDTERVALNSKNIIKESHTTAASNNQCIILHPYGVFRLSWDILVMMLLIWTCIEVPFTLAFNIVLTLDDPFGVCALLIDCLLLLDVYLNFRTAYFDRYNPFQLITNPSEIGAQYVKTWFLLDLLTSIPFEFLVPTTNNDATRILKLLRIFRLLRLLKLLRFLRMMKVFNNMLRGILTRTVVMVLKCVRIICLMILTAHYVSCLWWFFGRESLAYYDESWIQNEKWNMLDADTTITQQYIKSFYFSVVTLYTTGYGDITPINTMEEVVCSVLILLGTMFFAYFLGEVSGLVTEGDLIRSQQIQKIEEAQAFCVSKKLPAPLSIQVMTHLKYYWASNSILNDEEVIKCLPPQIQRSVAKHCDKSYLIDQLPIFQPLNAYIRGLIALKLKSISCAGDEYLFKEGEFGQTLYIQRTGTSLIAAAAAAGDCIQSERGTVSGYASFIKPQRQSSLKTLSYSEFWCLDYCDVRSILKQTFPRTWQKFWDLIQHQIQILYEKQQMSCTIRDRTDHANTKRSCRKRFNIHHEGDRRDQRVKQTARKIKGTIDCQREMDRMKEETKQRRITLVQKQIQTEKEEEKKEEEIGQNKTHSVEDDRPDEAENVQQEEEEEKEETKMNSENVQLLTVPKQRYKVKKRQRKKKKKEEIFVMDDDDEMSSSNSMFGENSLNSLSKSIPMQMNITVSHTTGCSDEHEEDCNEDHLGPLLSYENENEADNDNERNKIMIAHTRKYSLIESQTKSD